MSFWIYNDHLILLCARVCICTYTHLYMYNIYTIYIWIYIGNVYTFIHNIVYIVSTGDKLNWVHTLACVYLSPAPSVHFKQSGAFIYFFKVHFQCRITVIHWFLGKGFWWEKSDGSQPQARETWVLSCRGLTWQCQACAWVITGHSGLRAPSSSSSSTFMRRRRSKRKKEGKLRWGRMGLRCVCRSELFTLYGFVQFPLGFG